MTHTGLMHKDMFDQVVEQRDAALDKVKKLEREVHALRLFGNKDCTSQADEYLAQSMSSD